MQNKSKWTLPCLIVIVALVVGGCGHKPVKTDLSLKERMQLGLRQFEKKKFLDAKNQFRIITLSYSGSADAAEAQYYLAECHYGLKEYILAGSEYERLLKVYPNSDFVDDAKLKLGMCYFKLSPKFSLDQDYTNKAIREFQEFLEEYHSSTLVPSAQQKLNECREKLAHKVYAAADQYYKMGYWDSAVIYFNMVLDGYYDSRFSPQAQYLIGECYRKMTRTAEARDAFQKVIEKYPRHDLASRARKALRDLKTDTPKNPAEGETK